LILPLILPGATTALGQAGNMTRVADRFFGGVGNPALLGNLTAFFDLIWLGNDLWLVGPPIIGDELKWQSEQILRKI
jgi:hypothetical protein